MDLGSTELGMDLGSRVLEMDLGSGVLEMDLESTELEMDFGFIAVAILFDNPFTAIFSFSFSISFPSLLIERSKILLPFLCT